MCKYGTGTSLSISITPLFSIFHRQLNKTIIFYFTNSTLYFNLNCTLNNNLVLIKYYVKCQEHFESLYHFNVLL